jgi:enterochelin esterase-like enzyme
MRRCRALFSTLFLLAVAVSAQDRPAGHLRVRVSLDPAASSTPASGRLIVLMTNNLKPLDTIDVGLGDEAKGIWLAAKEIHGLEPGATVEFDPDDLAAPEPFSSAPAGDYQLMALLDVDHNAAYRTFTAGDLRSAVVPIKSLNRSQASEAALSLSTRVTEPAVTPPEGADAFDFVSASLSKFWGREIHMRGFVVLPPDYAASSRRYPAVYFTHGFGGYLGNLASRFDPPLAKGMKEGNLPPMIWVLLDQSFSGGTHEFLDSLNNGPWGTALTAELIPHLERTYRMERSPRGRFLNGHSSGGWATLWLQVTYPTIFGGTWSTSPDPVDFREFTNVDLSMDTNMYRDKNGALRPLVRMDGRNVEDLEQFAKQEAVLGDYGGQLASFEWVFSPRGMNGVPAPLFDRRTGAIDRAVARYWLDRYDIRQILTTNAARLAPRLHGKIHVIVGTEDTFFLDRAVRRLELAIDSRGYDARFTYIPGRNHFDLYDGHLLTRIAMQMYATAFPSAQWKPRVAPDPVTELAK